MKPKDRKVYEKEGRLVHKLMVQCFRSFGLSDSDISQKLAAIFEQVKSSNGAFQLIRIRDVVYTAGVTGKGQLELHALIGGQDKQDTAYRVEKLQNTLPNALATVYQFGAEVVYCPMPKKEAVPYDETMELFGFTKVDIPEEDGVKDMIVYVARLR